MPAPTIRGQGNGPFNQARPTQPVRRGQEVPYNVNGAPAGGTVDWGGIAGTLSDQLDLVSALAAKLDDSQASIYGLSLLAAASAAAAKTLLVLAAVATSGDAADLTGTLSNLRLAAFTGDVTKPAGSGVLTLATVNTNTGAFGGAKTSVQISLNGKGLATGASAVTIQPDYTNIDAVPTSRFLGRITAATGFAEALTAAQAKTLLAIAAADVSGLAAIATSGSASDLSAGTVPAARMPAHTGDVTTAAGAVATTLATVNSNVGSFGSATQVATFTVNAKGLTTAAANVTITPAVGSITGLGTGVATALAVNVGSAGAFVTFNGALGTPSSGTLTNCTFPTLNQNTTGSAAKWTTPRNVDGQALDGSADITVIAPGTHAATTKATPVDADELPLVDSAASNVLKKLTLANLKATLKTYFDTLYGALASANAWSAIQTITKANAGALALRSGASGSYVYASVGRTAEEGFFGVCGGVNQFFLSTAAGDVVFRAATTLHLGTGNGSANAQIILSSSGTAITGLVNAANDAAAAAAGVPVGYLYRNGSVLQIRVT